MKRVFSKMSNEEKLLEALVIYPNERTKDRRRLVNIASAQAKRKEKTKKDIVMRAIPYIPELNVFVAVYESPFKKRSITPLEARGREGSER